jgi:hypothetical protein
MSRAIRGIYRRYATSGEYTWYIDKCIKRVGRLCESSGTGDRDEAERYLHIFCIAYASCVTSRSTVSGRDVSFMKRPPSTSTISRSRALSVGMQQRSRTWLEECRGRVWWVLTGSNRLPSPCKGKRPK